MTQEEGAKMASERNEQHLLVLIEEMQRAGHDEAEIVRAVETASDPCGRTPRPARKNSPWRVLITAQR
jgi:hypothetical protein